MFLRLPPPICGTLGWCCVAVLTYPADLCFMIILYSSPVRWFKLLRWTNYACTAQLGTLCHSQMCISPVTVLIWGRRLLIGKQNLSHFGDLKDAIDSESSSCSTGLPPTLTIWSTLNTHHCAKFSFPFHPLHPELIGIPLCTDLDL